MPYSRPTAHTRGAPAPTETPGPDARTPDAGNTPGRPAPAGDGAADCRSPKLSA